MTKMKGDARVRLQQAALALFREHGYERTTAAEIAARAGLTERTFFRHFPDKREVLFDGEAILRKALTASIRDAPTEARPLDVLFRAFRSVTPLLEANRPFSEPRQEVIAATPALHERELSKMEALAEALATSLKERNVPDRQAILAARAGMAAFVDATVSWIEDPGMTLGERIDIAERDLKAVL
ncbi:TetR family transcriptional regulator [Martelella lutilitoris]|uniref:TetR family transcriptional regulator n=1 Tax=Martelella lutilitoris TaxID=2583532 RepID=A0A5C4JLP0_9HYPH|nr:TetR/AcrR family transcriptional regulator [Martelella lutilitoris]TNB46217.1 TetR family transcriptional regulator [Martelella lutilitoris]